MKYLIRNGLFFSLFLISNLAFAEIIYQWRDAQGNLHFSDVQPEDKKARVINIQPKRMNDLPQVVHNNVQQPKRQLFSVTLFSSKTCRDCAQARRYFKNNNIVYHEQNIDQSSSAKHKFNSLGGKSNTPLILVGTTPINGFNRELLDSIFEM